MQNPGLAHILVWGWAPHRYVLGLSFTEELYLTPSLPSEVLIIILCIVIFIIIVVGAAGALYVFYRQKKSPMGNFNSEYNPIYKMT